jgi:hypothetical protein
MDRFEHCCAALQTVASETDISRVLRAYVASLPDTLLSALPRDCQGALEDDDLQAAAVVLLRGELAHRGSLDVGRSFTELARAYAAASVRLTRIRFDHHALNGD